MNRICMILGRVLRYYKLSDWRGTFSHDGGALTNQGVHYIDLLRHNVRLITEGLSISTVKK